MTARAKSKKLPPVSSEVFNGAKRYDLVLVYWIDIQGSKSGAVSEAEPALCISPCVFYGVKRIKGEECLVVVDTVYPNEKPRSSQGWDAMPVSVVRKVEVLRKAAQVKWGADPA